MDTPDIVIVGAGFAGAATAWALAERGVPGVLVLEREPVPGRHASGRNAGMIRNEAEDPTVRELTRRGSEFLRSVPQEFATGFRRTGSVLLDPPFRSDRLVPVSRNEVEERIPCARNGRWETALHDPCDGIVDPQTLLNSYLCTFRAAGGRVLFSCPALGWKTRDSRIQAVRTPRGWIRARTFVNAAGAWARSVGTAAGGAALPIQPFRRHLFFGFGPRRFEGPFLWHLREGIYVRPESGGLVTSPCDQTPHPPGVPPTDPSFLGLLASKARRVLPDLSSFTPIRSWACLRTLAPDGRFVIGPDPILKNLFWVAALGGHGVTAAAAVGRLAAPLLCGETCPDGAPFRPDRFTQSG